MRRFGTSFLHKSPVAPAGYKILRENQLYILVPEASDVYFPPLHQLSRDVSLLVVQEFCNKKQGLRVLDVMGGTGIRSINYLRSLP